MHYNNIVFTTDGPIARVTVNRCATDDMREGTNAFLNKRNADFSGS